MRTILLTSALALALTASAAGAQTSPLGVPSYGAWHPSVPVSPLGNPASWLDPTRLHVSTSVSVGSFGGQGTDALQVTSLSYQFRSPLLLSVSVGNAWGSTANSTGTGSNFFLEGMRLAWQPSSHTIFQFEYRDVRSPLQYGYWGQPLGPARLLP
jgi:hypothetical protein